MSSLRFAIASNVLYLHVLCYDYVELDASCKLKVSINVDIFYTKHTWVGAALPFSA